MGGRGAGDRRRFIGLGGDCPGVAGAVLELDEVAFSKPQLNIPSLGMLRLGGLYISVSGGQERGSEVSVLVSPLVTYAVAFSYDTSGHHGFSGMGTRYFDDVEAYFLTKNETPAIVPEVAII